jgi:hypothetical protein
MNHALRFRTHPGPYAVCRLHPEEPTPAWAEGEGFRSVTVAGGEKSIVCLEARVPPDIRQQGGWAIVELLGPFSFELTGVLLAIVSPLAAADVPVFAISTFDTDWVLVPRDRLAVAVQALKAAGHNEI